MKPRLTVVLELRQAAEDTARREVGRLERERAELVAVRAGREASLASVAAAGAMTAFREQLAAFCAATRAAIAEDGVRLAACDKTIAAARAVLAEAHREVKAIEAIRARDTAMERQRMLRHEARANDEHALRGALEISA